MAVFFGTVNISGRLSRTATSSNYTQINSAVIDSWVDGGWVWGVPISHETFLDAQQGRWSVLLTPAKPVPVEWFAPFLAGGRLDSVSLLGLASGGGQQMPVFAALGAICTVLDNSARQLASEHLVATREGYAIETVKADMTKRLPFDDESFDMIFHPVSNCYVEDVYHVWNECFRVLKPGGVLLAGVDNGLAYLFDEAVNPLLVVNPLPYNPIRDAALYEKLIGQGEDSIQFSHTVEEQIGGQLKAGFTLTDLFEDSDETVIGTYVPLFIATRAIKPRA